MKEMSKSNSKQAYVFPAFWTPEEREAVRRKALKLTKLDKIARLANRHWTAEFITEDDFLKRWKDVFRFVHNGYLTVGRTFSGYEVTLHLEEEHFPWGVSTLFVETESEVEDFIERIPSSGFIFTEDE